MPRGCHVITRQLVQQVWGRGWLPEVAGGVRWGDLPPPLRDGAGYTAQAPPLGQLHALICCDHPCLPASLPPCLQIPELAEFEVGLANFFVQHTSASLTINENASPGGLLLCGMDPSFDIDDTHQW